MPKKTMRQKSKNTHKKSLLVALGAFGLFLGTILFLVALQNHRDVAIHATAATKLSFSPVSSEASPIQKNPQDVIPLDIMVDPGTNTVSLVIVSVQYDSGKLQYVDNSFQPDATTFPTIVEGPLVTPGIFSVIVSIGSDPTKGIISPVKLGTLSFTAVDGTGGTPTRITYTAKTSALSIGTNDNATENVVATTDPVYIAIAGASNNPTATPAPVVTDVPQPSSVPTDILVPTGVGGPVATVTIPVPNPTTKPPSKYKQSVIRSLEKRLVQLQERLAKLQKKKNISKRDIAKLETKIKAAIKKVQNQLASVRRSHQDKDVKKYVKAILKDLLADYKELAVDLRKFKHGLDGVKNSKSKSGKDAKKAEANLASMDKHITNAETLIDKTDKGIDATATDEQMSLAITAVQQNGKIIKNEFDKASTEMNSAAQELQSSASQ
jgi:hypothetical protein